jgi:hypothetical protein
MQKQLQASVWIISFLSLSFCSCKKEHLDPAPSPISNSGPLVSIAANMEGDTVYFAGGVDGYAGITAMEDIGNNRMFTFALKDSLHPLQSFFKISVNNYSNIQGNPQSDLDSSVYVSNRNYSGGLLFVPLSAGISWTDSTGIEYKSTPAMPNSFAITSVEDLVFESKKYKKALIEFECAVVYNFTDTIHLKNGKATVLFSAE